ncbi:MAG: 4a-hydroxytetrahydrobiopterin dehydratase [bacterium]|nr:4a-hydroxytetrahydrobiopterin dehydratase [bacterium]
MSLFSREEITSKLKHLSGWQLDGQSIRKEFVFPTFSDAMIFVNEVAQAAEDMEHHPDIAIHHSTVKVASTTHDMGGITEKDIALAEKAQEAEKMLFGDLSK